MKKYYYKLLAVVTLFSFTIPGQAATITVDTLDDIQTPNGNCSLRDAIAAPINNVSSDTCPAGSVGLDTIEFSAGLTGTITLSTSLPFVTESVTITGPGAVSMTVSGANAYRVFNFNSLGGSQEYSLSGVTVTEGASPLERVSMWGRPTPCIFLPV